MREKEKELLLAYFVNQSIRLEDELNELRNRIRFRRIDQSDCLELSLLLQRLADFNEFSLTVIRLLNLSNCI